MFTDPGFKQYNYLRVKFNNPTNTIPNSFLQRRDYKMMDNFTVTYGQVIVRMTDT